MYIGFEVTEYWNKLIKTKIIEIKKIVTQNTQFSVGHSGSWLRTREDSTVERANHQAASAVLIYTPGHSTYISLSSTTHLSGKCSRGGNILFLRQHYNRVTSCRT